MDHLIELDSRKRCSLGPLALGGRRLYLGTVDEHGVITLTPAVVVEKRSLEALSDGR